MAAKKKLLFNTKLLAVTLRRLCAELIEQHGTFSDTLLLGLQPRGVFLARRLQNNLRTLGHDLSLGELDVTFHRDDFRNRKTATVAHPTRIDFSLENKNVILIDDVLYTGRSVRAALDALLAYGRPRRVELLVLIDRIQCRDMPISATYVGRSVNTLPSQHILLELSEQRAKDGIWLAQKEVAT